MKLVIDTPPLKSSVSVFPPQATELPGYLAQWMRNSDNLERYRGDIHTIAATGESIIESMKTKKGVISWDDILIKGAQIAKVPLNSDVSTNSKTIFFN